MVQTRSTCPYCGVGCGVIIDSEGGRITGVQGDPDHPANRGRLCTKGSTLHLTATESVQRQTRLLQPLRRLARGVAPVAITWDAALDLAADRLAAIHRAHGPQAIGVYISGQLLTEDYYVFNKLVKGLWGSNEIDTNSRLCMSSAVAGYKMTLGADAPPCSYEDLDAASTVLIAGSNMAWTHPVLFRRLEDARRARPQQKWIVVDPRRTETAEMADLHLQLLPGSDVALYHGLLHLMLWEGLVQPAYIEAHTRGFEALKARVREFTPSRTAQLTGLKESELTTAANWFGAGAATLSLYCQGLNQSASGTAKNAALINLHLATGQIGKPGAGPFSLTGQPNAMGGREVGGMANLLSGHRDLADPVHRAEVAAQWGVPDVPATPGRTAVEMFEAAARGEVRALWIACTNPAQSMPDQDMVRRALQRVDFVILQEAFATTATAAYADLLLPATTWGEKDGTVTNSERRISRVRAAVAAPGQARHDWCIARDVALRLAAQIAPERAALFDYPTPESVWNEHRELTRGRDLDITGLSYAMLDAQGPQQWPVVTGATAGRARLYEDGRFATGDARARFADVAYTPVVEPRSAQWPFSLLTGRLRDQWHGMSRTGTLGRLYGHDADPVVELHPLDMERLKVAQDGFVRVSSRRGAVVLRARAADAVARNQAFIAMHWGEEALSGRHADGTVATGVNALTSPALCPSSHQPELKHASVRIEKVELPWCLTAMAWLPNDTALATREQIKPMLTWFETASLVPFGREPDPQSRVGLLLRAASSRPLGAQQLAPLHAAFGLDVAGTLGYADPRRGQQRTLRIDTDASGAQRLQGFWWAGDAAGTASLSALLAADDVLPAPGRSLLAPGGWTVREVTPRSPQVCTCWDVNEAAIRAALPALTGSTEKRVADLGSLLKCGTQCGSCLPTLRKLAAAVPALACTTG